MQSLKIKNIIGKLTPGFLMSRDDPLECQTCDDRLTVEHILVHCREYESLRRRCFLNYESAKKYFLNDVDSSHGGSLYYFIRDICILKIL